MTPVASAALQSVKSFDNLPDELVEKVVDFLIEPVNRLDSATTGVRCATDSLVSLSSCSKKLLKIGREAYNQVVLERLSEIDLNGDDGIELYSQTHNKLLRPEIALRFILPIYHRLKHKPVEPQKLALLMRAKAIDPTVQRLAREAFSKFDVLYICSTICFVRLNGWATRLPISDIPLSMRPNRK